MNGTPPNALAETLRTFFTEHLPVVCGLSPNTLLSYRDALVLFLRFLSLQRDQPVAALDLCDLDRDVILAFLDHLESDRGNKVSSRNVRLAALRSFAHYAAGRAPEHIASIQQILGVPRKRTPAPAVGYLEGDEFSAMLKETADSGPRSIRDYALLLTMLNTGARVSELLGIRPRDLCLDRPRQVRLLGKGRKERICPLWARTTRALRALLAEGRLDPQSREPLFRNYRGEPLTRFGARYILRKYANRAVGRKPTLGRKRVHPHAMRHTAAVNMLQAGVDLVTISRLLGHASVETTNRYLSIDLETKRQAVARAKLQGVAEPDVAAWKSDASVLEWLESL